MDRPRQQRRWYTLEDIHAMLQKECPEEFSLLPDTASFTFEDTPEMLESEDISKARPTPLCRFRLRIGTSTGEYTAADDPVFICIGGEDNTELALNCGRKLYKFNLDNLSYVDLEPTFRRLLLNVKEEQVLYSDERLRLRTCVLHLFLRGGYIAAIQSSPRFEHDLRIACTWLAREDNGPVRTARQKRATLRQKNKAAAKRRMKEEAAQNEKAKMSDTSGDRNIGCSPSGDSDSDDTPSLVVYESRTARALQGMTSRRKRCVEESGDENGDSDETSSRIPKRRSLVDGMADVSRRSEAMSQSLLAFDDAYAVVRRDLHKFKTECESQVNDTVHVEELEHKIKQQASEIDNLKHQLGEKNEQITSKDIRLIWLRAELSKSEALVKEVTAAREIEVKSKETAEAQLGEYIDAQKRIAAMYSRCGT